MRKFFKKTSFYIFWIAIIVLFNLFVARLTVVSGNSMYPYLQDKQLLIINETAKLTKNYDRFDIVVLKSEKLNTYLIKRIIGCPGDTIQIKEGSVYINDNLLDENISHDLIIDAGLAKDKITLGENEYFVLGDNRNNSADSRQIGPVNSSSFIGKVCFSFWPIKIIL